MSRVAVRVVVALALVGLVGLLTAGGHYAPASPPPPASSTSTAPVVATLPAPLSTSSTVAATVAATAARGAQVQATEPPAPPFDPVAYVNGLAYCWQCPAPAMEAYRVVATFYGWEDWKINGRAVFVQRIMAGESAFCWNSRAWSHDTYLLMPCTERAHQGRRDDVGFGQITNVLRPLTCEKVGVCSIAATIASPWSSMLAYVAVLDELGRRPWCYRDRYGRPNTHMLNGDCATWPG